jgi:hypothetical protein
MNEEKMYEGTRREDDLRNEIKKILSERKEVETPNKEKNKLLSLRTPGVLFRHR